MRLRALILLPFLLSLSLIVVKAQRTTTLQSGVPIERTIGQGQTHEFTVNASENSAVQLVVEQKSIDVVIAISAPDGKPVAKCDTPNGDQGPEHVSFIARETGKYRIAVTPFGEDESGQYEIKLVEVREATEEEIEASKNRAVAKAKGIALLLGLRDAISAIKSRQTRINAQIVAASMLREDDEKGAAKYLSDAVAGFKEFLASTEADPESYMALFSTLSQRRDQLVRVLAETDPDAALDLLHSTAPKYSPYISARDLMVQDSTLELAIADQLALKDPKRAVQIARQNLKKAYSPALLDTASRLAEKNPELANEILHDITSKLLGEEKLITSNEAANLALALANSYRVSLQGVERRIGTGAPWLQTFRHLPKDMLSEQDYKQLLQKMISEVLSYSKPADQPNPYGPGNAVWPMLGGLMSMGTELDKVVNGSSAALAKKQKDLLGNMNNYFTQYQEVQKSIANNPVETVLESIEKVPGDQRDQLYIQLAGREAGNGDMNRAKQIINENVENPYQRVQGMRTLEHHQIQQAVSNRKFEEALRNISALGPSWERAGLVSQVAAQIGPGQKRETALSLLEQARSLLPLSPQAETHAQMSALLAIARAFSHYDSKRSFEIIDPLIEQFNDLCAAARKLEGFGYEYFQEDELDLRSEGTLPEVAEQISNVLGELALINFDRAKATSDKLLLPEVRLHANLQIAAQTIGEPNQQE